MTTLFVDADACPVTRDALSVARALGVPVRPRRQRVHKNLTRYAGRSGVETLQSGSGRDAADFAIVERLAPDDVVVTGDTGPRGHGPRPGMPGHRLPRPGLLRS